MDKRCATNILKKYGAVIGNNCDIETPLVIYNAADYKNLRLGSSCHIGKSVLLDLKDKIILNDFVTVSMHTVILTHFNVGVGKSPLKNYDYTPQNQKVILETGCYIGAGSIILAGAIIGECSIVGAGAVVAGNVPPPIPYLQGYPRK